MCCLELYRPASACNEINAHSLHHECGAYSTVVKAQPFIGNKSFILLSDRLFFLLFDITQAQLLFKEKLCRLVFIIISNDLSISSWVSKQLVAYSSNMQAIVWTGTLYKHMSELLLKLQLSS